MSKPEIENYQYHAILCCGSKCGPEGDRSLLQYMKSKLLELGMNGVRVNRAGCLGVCVQGPIMVVYPGGVWYCNLNRENADRIIEEHFKQGRIVKELVFHQAETAVEGL
jgi:(2Fe-2S) ferredoxin